MAFGYMQGTEFSILSRTVSMQPAATQIIADRLLLVHCIMTVLYTQVEFMIITDQHPITEKHTCVWLQVDLPPCNVTLVSVVNGTANCNIYVTRDFFPAAGYTSLANLVLQLRLAGLTVSSDPATTISLHAAPVQLAPSKVTMLVTAPYRNLHPGVSSSVCLWTTDSLPCYVLLHVPCLSAAANACT